MGGTPHTADVTSERRALRSQGMVGYMIFHPAVAWDGAIFHRLHRAQAALNDMPAHAEVVLVRNSGGLYHQAEGRSTGPVLIPGGGQRTVSLSRANRMQLRREARGAQGKQQAAPAAPRWRGHIHLPYRD